MGLNREWGWKVSSSKKTYSSPTRRHIFFSNKKTYILLQQEDIYSSPTRRHIFFSNKTTYILLQQEDIYSFPTRRHILLSQEDIFFSHKKTCPMSIQHIPCLKSTHMSPEHTYRVHKDQTWSKSKNWRFWLFLGIEGWPLGHQILSSLIVFRGLELLKILILSSSKNWKIKCPKWSY